MVLNARSRAISFRMSEQEYQRLLEAAKSHAARSLSDFVRMSVFWVVDNPDPATRRYYQVTGAGLAPGPGRPVQKPEETWEMTEPPGALDLRLLRSQLRALTLAVSRLHELLQTTERRPRAKDTQG